MIGGQGEPEFPGSEDEATEAPSGRREGKRKRTLQLTQASTIRIRSVRWLWKDRLAAGTVALLGGREGIGKSLFAAHLVAQLTTGKLEGIYTGKPQAVLVAATEDAWDFTIVPRLEAAGADLTLVYKIDVATAGGTASELSVPLDLVELEQRIEEVEASLLVLDPFLSRVDAKLDTHKDAEVRRALEPLAALADRSSAVVLGLIHVSKAKTADPLTALMGSRAFTAVPRAVLFMMVDPEDEGRLLVGQAKNNLGRSDLPTLAMRIESVSVGQDEDGEVTAPRLVSAGEEERSIRDALEAAGDGEGVLKQSASAAAARWLKHLLSRGAMQRKDVMLAAAKAGHAKATVERAAKKIGVESKTSGFPQRALWALSGFFDSEAVENEGSEATEVVRHPVPSVPSLFSVPRAPDGWDDGESDEWPN